MTIGFNPGSWTTVPRVQTEEMGFHTNSYLELSNRKFITAISSGSSVKLCNTAAPAVTSGTYCELSDNCSIGSVQARNSVKAKNCKIDSISVGSYCEVEDKCSIRSIKAKNSVKAEHSEIKSIEANTYIELNAVKNLEKAEASNSIQADNLVECPNAILIGGTYIELERSQVSSLEAKHSIKMTKAMAKTAKSGTYIEAKESTIENVDCNSFEGSLSALENLKAEQKVELHQCCVVKLLEAGTDIIATNCESLGVVKAKESASLTQCPTVGSITAPDISVQNCTVIGDIEGDNVKLRDTTAKGTVTAKNREMKLFNSHIKKLVMKAPLPPKVIAGIEVSGDVPTAILPLVREMQAGRLHITPNGSGYSLQYQGPSSNRWGGCSSTCANGDIVVKCIGSGGFSMKDNQITLSDWSGGPAVTLSTDKKVIAAAVAFMKEANKPKSAPVANANTQPKQQVVTVNGGHVEEIVFEVPGGIVITLGDATVGKIINEAVPGVNQEAAAIQKEIAELPYEYMDPVSLETMQNPYITPSKQNFDRETLERLLNKQTKKITCPLTRQQFTLEACKPNSTLQAQIQEWLKNHEVA